MFAHIHRKYDMCVCVCAVCFKAKFVPGENPIVFENTDVFAFTARTVRRSLPTSFEKPDGWWCTAASAASAAAAAAAAACLSVSMRLTAPAIIISFDKLLCVHII